MGRGINCDGHPALSHTNRGIANEVPPGKAAVASEIVICITQVHIEHSYYEDVLGLLQNCALGISKGRGFQNDKTKTESKVCSS
jgi:hypothetical protein